MSTRAAQINAQRYVGTPTGCAHKRTVAEHAMVARDNYFRAAEDHRRMAARCRTGTEEHDAHLRLAASFELKAHTMVPIMVRSQSVYGKRAVELN